MSEGGQGLRGLGVSEGSWRGSEGWGLEGSQSIGGRAFGHLGVSKYIGHIYTYGGI